MGLALIVHGGAGAMSRDRFDAAREGCRQAAAAGWMVLRCGGRALDAVQAAIQALEDNPGFNAGTGGVLTTEGRAQLDAGIMDGGELAVGAVAGVEHIKNPIVLARAVLDSPHVLLMGAGAEQFALETGMPLCDPSELITPSQYERWQRGYRSGDAVNVGPVVSFTPATAGIASSTSDASASNGVNGGNGGNGNGARASKANGSQRAHRAHARSSADAEPIHSDADKHGTVGAVAVDAAGNVAAGASTGGIAAKHPGRIGDTPLVGCGFCAENGLGGVSSTGHGEDFIRLLLARRALDYIAAGMSAQAAATAAIRQLDERVHGDGGLILLDGQGRVGYARNTPSMAHAFIVEGMDTPFAAV